MNTEPDKLITYKIDEAASINTDIKIVYKDMNSIVPANRTSTGFAVNNALRGEKIWIVALQFKDGTPYLALKESVINQKTEHELAFEPYTSLDALKNELQKLNN